MTSMDSDDHSGTDARKPADEDHPGKEPVDRPEKPRKEPLDSNPDERVKRASGCHGREPDQDLANLFARAEREGLDRSTLKKELDKFFKEESRNHHRLTDEDRRQIYKLMDSRFDRGMRCGDWYSMDDLGTNTDRLDASKVGRLMQIGMGLGDLLSSYAEMQARSAVGKGYIGQDHHYHCLGHCQAASRGPGGQLASKIVANWRESGDSKKNAQATGNATRAVIDSFVDSYVNRVGFRGGMTGTRCSDHCARLRPSGM